MSGGAKGSGASAGPTHPVSTGGWVFAGRASLLIGAIACLFGGISSAAALVSGILLAVLIGNPELERTRKLTHPLLSNSVIGLGAGMNLITVAKVGSQGIGITFVGISLTLALGLALGRWLKTSKDASWLLSVGTAICGGSAIAAVAPVIRAKSQDISVALGTVFLLNALALIVFPGIGHHFGMSEAQFGLWSALAIHDTSSVVGSTLQYGAHALEVGTTTKLARALWIIPLTFFMGWLKSRQGGDAAGESKPKRPWFILGFLAMAALVTFVPALQPAGQMVEKVARRTLVLTLFVIGANLTLETLKSVGFRPLLQGVLLWVIVAGASLAAILSGVAAS